MIKTSITIACVMIATMTQAQFSGNDIAEYQIGNLPDIKPRYLNTLYNRVNLQ